MHLRDDRVAAAESEQRENREDERKPAEVHASAFFGFGLMKNSAIGVKITSVRNSERWTISTDAATPAIISTSAVLRRFIVNSMALASVKPTATAAHARKAPVVHELCESSANTPISIRIANPGSTAASSATVAPGIPRTCAPTSTATLVGLDPGS